MKCHLLSRESALSFVTVLGMAGFAASDAAAVNVQTQSLQGDYTTNMYGGSQWTNFTALLDASHSMSVTADFTSIGAVDALLVNQEYNNGPLSGAEISAITSFVSAGNRAVVFGENDSWAAWNASIMSMVGGGHTNTCNSSTGAPLVANDLTAGASAVSSVCGSVINSVLGAPQMLFDNDFAAVFGVGAGEVLVILDSNWNDDSRWNTNDNAVFAQNVVDWLGGTTAPAVPLPASLPILLSGFGAFGLLRARRKT